MKNIINTTLLGLILLVGTYTNIQAQNDPSELEQITATLMDYIEGTAEGDPERIDRAFHSDLNLYTVDSDTLKTLSGKKYISYFENRQKRNRLGKIVSIDYENDAASAKIEVIMPARKRIYTDYLLLLKVEGHWKIIHKSYTFKEFPGKQKMSGK